MLIKKITIIASLALIAVLAVGWSVLMNSLSAETGKMVGTSTGEAVGLAIGSLKGITEKLPEGLEAGKKDGLSAKDTTVDIQTNFKETQKLEVLVTSFKLNNYHALGNTYAALYFAKAEAVFAIDLTGIIIDQSSDGKTLFLRVPSPEVTISIDEKSINKAEEYQKKFFDGSAEDGFEAYLNSMANIESDAQKTIMADENMMSLAKNAGESQLALFVKGISIETRNIEVIWY